MQGADLVKVDALSLKPGPDIVELPPVLAVHRLVRMPVNRLQLWDPLHLCQADFVRGSLALVVTTTFNLEVNL